MKIYTNWFLIKKIEFIINILHLIVLKLIKQKMNTFFLKSNKAELTFFLYLINL